jgi:ribosomal protein L18E
LWWLLAGCLLEILCEPLRAFLLEIAQQAGSAIRKRLAQRLRQSRRGKRRSNRR